MDDLTLDDAVALVKQVPRWREEVYPLGHFSKKLYRGSLDQVHLAVSDFAAGKYNLYELALTARDFPVALFTDIDGKLRDVYNDVSRAFAAQQAADDAELGEMGHEAYTAKKKQEAIAYVRQLLTTRSV